MRIDIVTVLPELVAAVLQHGVLRRAADKGLVDIRVHDIRTHALDKHRQVDDYPYGGGAGMVLKPEPVFRCIEAILSESDEPVDEIVYFAPDGETLTQETATVLSLQKRLVFLAGHYIGVDQRIRDTLVTREISMGDYVLSGGELPALALADAMARLIPGVLGDAESALSDSFQDGLLGAPVYTRPAEFRGMRVPDVLLSGDHKEIARWREGQRQRLTARRRPDLSEQGIDLPKPGSRQTSS